MKSFLVKPASSLRGRITLPGDKSIAHRAVIIAAISKGKTSVKNFPANKDCLVTVKAIKDLGIRIIYSRKTAVATIFGRGLRGLRKPKKYIFASESGTTFRLLLGILAGQDFLVTLKAGNSLSTRPMRRVTEPLRMMGAKIYGQPAAGSRQPEEYPPIIIRGGSLHPITYRMPVASAQVKSAILLAGLYADGTTKISEPLKTRDHSERMLSLYKADIKIKNNFIAIKGNKNLLSPSSIYIPADISSAAFFMVAAAILPDSKIIIENVSLNPSRTGIIRVLKRMGADIKFRVKSQESRVQHEPMGDIIVESSVLKGARVSAKEVPSLIDELPILMVAACFAKSRTIFNGVQELRFKETDRIRAMSDNLRKMGAKIKVLKRSGSEIIVVDGITKLRGRKVRSFGDHRTAMSMIIAGLRAEGSTLIDDVSCIDKSFPEFLTILKSLIK